MSDSPDLRALEARVWPKYLAFQLPGAFVVFVLAYLSVHHELVPLWLAVALCAAWIVKDAVMYPFVRHAYGPGPKDGAEVLQGARGVVTETCAPEGWVRVGAELWRARAPEGEALAIGSAIRVREVQAMTLAVEAAADD